MDLSGLLPLISRGLPDSATSRAAGEEVIGVPDSAKAATIAALIVRHAGPVLVIAGKADHARSLSEETSAWLGTTARVLEFPELDDAPYERSSPDTAAAEERLRVLARLRQSDTEQPPVIVTCGLALAQGTIAPDALAGASLTVQPGDRLPMRLLLSTLERLGYTMEPLVEEPGQAARRGGIVDVYPPDALQPFRLELLGDRVDSLRAFDPATQRTLHRPQAVTIGPAREAQADPARVRALLERLDFSRMQLGTRPGLEEPLQELAAGRATTPGFYAPFLLDATLLDHLPAGALVIVDEPADLGTLLDELDQQAQESRAAQESEGLIPAGLPLPHRSRTEVFARLDSLPRVALRRWATDETPGALLLPFGPAPAYGGRLRTVMNDVATRIRGGGRLVMVTQQAPRLSELLTAEGLMAGIGRQIDAPPPPGSLTLLQGSLPHGWSLPLADGLLLLITDSEVFGFTKQRREVRRAARGREAFLSELSPGDYVVHIEHGIARFARLTRRTVDGTEREYLELHYAEGDRLFVPADQVDRVSRYVGPGDSRPHLTRLGSGDWARAKERVRRAVADLAQELLQLYAAREVLPGHPFAEDTVWQQEMEAAFPYVETDDQLRALREIKTDMERPRPMDRIIIGDVGYGKTELAIRAAFKAVMDGKQAAVLVPTTVLAQQHFQTFSERVSGFPVRVEVLSRFRSEREQREVVAAVAAGRVDILIGTHRILQRDVQFHDLGLVVIDEEQRFGVAHKERLKELRREVDVLTLSATPIPRTLNMSLAGIRDMSTLETAPEDRLPIKTYVTEFDERLLREALLRELDRGGQVYFVHNRVYNIELIAEKLRAVVPEAEISIGHGQMPEEMLEQVMVEFQRGACDVLVCTTIIESGLDIPNVNTIVINQADRLGLSQLYQLRGRVGRGAARAYAYLLYDRNHALSEVAQRRLQAIFEAGELGAGFQIALKDLEIRGAGNLLGAEQSGHIGAVGYDLYAQMLAEAVSRMRALMHGETPPPAPLPPLTVDLPITAHLPEPYITDLNLRLAVYQRLAQMPSVRALEEYTAELTDRFGSPPPVALTLLYTVRIRLLARAAGLQSIQGEDGDIVLRAARPIVHRERLSGVFPEHIRIGSAQIRIERRDGWRAGLLAVLERLQPDWSESAGPAGGAGGVAAPSRARVLTSGRRPDAVRRETADYGTFAPETPRRGPAPPVRPGFPPSRPDRRNEGSRPPRRRE